MSHSVSLDSRPSTPSLAIRRPSDIPGRWPVAATIGFAAVSSVALWSMIAGAVYAIF